MRRGIPTATSEPSSSRQASGAAVASESQGSHNFPGRLTMQAFTPRAGRRSLARTIFVLAAGSALSACAAEATAPALNPSPRANAAAALAPTVYTTPVDLYVGSHI